MAAPHNNYGVLLGIKVFSFLQSVTGFQNTDHLRLGTGFRSFPHTRQPESREKAIDATQKNSGCTKPRLA
ncbi:hypothetical protein VTN96DRAFT_6088 [Rasamsonia emersonii]